MGHLLRSVALVGLVAATMLATFGGLAGCNKKTDDAKAAPAQSGTIAITVDDTCATEVVFPELSIKKELPKNTPVSITVPTDKEQKLTFQCGMGMYKSSVVVSGS
jgi:hypothetical protein